MQIEEEMSSSSSPVNVQLKYETKYDTLSANVVNLFPKRYQNSDDQQDEKNIFSKIP